MRIRLVEYSAGYLADHWCQKGHIVHCLEGEFTLVSDHKESLHLLLDEIQKWIEHKQFPLKSIRNELLEILKVSLKNDYQFDLKFKP